MMLRFYAREGLVREPGRRPFIGQAAVYLGREFVPPRASENGAIVDAAYPATKDGFTWDTEKHEHAHTEHVLRSAREGAFWPADKATAEALKVQLADIEFKDGLWLEKPKAADKTPASGGKRGE